VLILSLNNKHDHSDVLLALAQSVILTARGVAYAVLSYDAATCLHMRLQKRWASIRLERKRKH
jgi:hypothetical protein